MKEMDVTHFSDVTIPLGILVPYLSRLGNVPTTHHHFTSFGKTKWRRTRILLLSSRE